MSNVPFHYVDLRTFCYGTEDDKRVEDALRAYLPKEYDVERQVTTGHHGDRIVVLSARLENAADVRYVLGRLVELPDYDDVIEELDDRISEDCSLYLTLDKQAAVRGEIRRGDGIMLRAKVEAYPAKRESAVENAREAFAAARDG
jgi:RNA binding exosome subunit